MALQRSRHHDLPKDAVVLTETEALAYQTNILNKWDNRKDVFAYRYGIYTLGSSSFASAVYIHSHYRRKLKLLNFGKISTFLPVCLLPSLFSVFLHGEFVLRNLVLQNEPCPVCVETRAALFQAAISCVFPAVLAPLATFSVAHKYGTFNLPDIVSEKMKSLQLIQKINKPISNKLVGILLGQALLAIAVTHFEAKSIITVNEKLIQAAQEEENK